ncbi:unnamed protein product [Phaedon cochleariae]|uniref:Sodium channel protein Nach n=1 Tax=Phaedon cochleariae TaxID=80249 RepID=A0A9N9X118_PHACE|nr:unnamed protein product [Phaedon cochleariae]
MAYYIMSVVLTKRMNPNYVNIILKMISNNDDSDYFRYNEMIEKDRKESVIKSYLLNSSFHGYRYVVEDGRHWTERVFWIICCTLGWIAAGLLVHSSWNDFQNNAISFVVETSYLDWDSKFPAVVVCETDNQEDIAKVTDKVYGDPHDYNLDEMVNELVYYKGLTFFTLQTCGPDLPHRNPQCLLQNLSFFSDKVRRPCNSIFQKCAWQNEEFDCCKYFRPMNTELGKCFGINSMQTIERFPPKYKMVSNKNTGPGSLYMELKGFSNVYTFGAEEVPSLTSLASDILQIAPHIGYQRFLAIKEIENQPEVKYVSVEQRKCRFPEESDLDVFRYYSYSACCVQCRKEAQFKKCGCVHHLLPNTTSETHCTLDGLQCLTLNFNELSVLKASWANRTGLVCGCLPSCTELELSVTRDHKNGIVEDYAIVKLSLERLPTERFKRNVVRGKLDLVVSMGGATSLFLGASLLSFVEIFYYFIVRPLTDCKRRRRQKNKGIHK